MIPTIDIDVLIPGRPDMDEVALVYRIPNLTMALTNLRQLLVPGGRFAAAVWGTAEQVPFSILNRTIQQVRKLPPPAPGTPNTFSLGDENLLSQHFRKTGFSEVHTERLTVMLEYASLALFFKERQETSALTRVLIEGATEEERTAIRQSVTEALQPYTEADGVIRLPNETLCVVAW